MFGNGGFRLAADWALDAGARCAVLGPSGAGKSTLLAGIAGFADQVSGTVRADGQALPPVPQHRPVAMLFQDHNLFPHLTVAQNVGLGLRPSLKLTAAERARVADALGQVGLAGLEARKPAELSGGQQSRAAIARLLVMARPVMLLDEPFSALGPAQRTDMLRLVVEVAAKVSASVIMVTHNPEEARALAGLVSFVDGGVASVPAPVEDFFARPPQALRDYIG
nr:ATP-binding cassette domain-containing protein [Aliishimia ponticola]